MTAKLISLALAIAGTAVMLLAVATPLLRADGSTESRYCKKTGSSCGATHYRAAANMCTSCSTDRDEDKCYTCSTTPNLTCGDSDASCGYTTMARATGSSSNPCPDWDAPGQGAYFNSINHQGELIPCPKMKQCDSGASTEAMCAPKQTGGSTVSN